MVLFVQDTFFSIGYIYQYHFYQIIQGKPSPTESIITLTLYTKPKIELKINFALQHSTQNCKIAKHTVRSS